MRVKYKLIKNTVANYVLGFWSFIVTFILLFLILRGYGPLKPIGGEDYGIYLLIGAMVGYFGLIDQGIGYSLVKFIAQYHAKGEKQKVNEIVSTSFFLFLGIGLIGAVGIFILGTFFIDYFNFSDDDQLLKARIITYLLGIVFVTSFSRAIFRDILRGLQKFVLIAYISFAMSVLNIIVVIGVLLNGFGIIEFLFYTLSFSLIGPVIISIYVKRELPYLDIRRKYLNKKMVRSLFGLSTLLFLLFFFNMIVFYTDNIVIGWWFVGTAMVTFYVTAHRLYSIPGKTISYALRAMIPAASELDALKKTKSLQILLVKVSKYCLALLFLFGLPTMFMSKQILTYWLGPSYAVYFMVTNILIFSIFFDYFNYVSSQILIGMNRIKFLVAGYGIVALMNLVLSVILVQSMGLEGVAWGTAVPFIIMSVPLMWSAFKIIGINWKNYIKEVYVKTIPFAMCMVGVLFVLMQLHIPANLMEVGVYYAISMGVFLVLFYYFALNSEEKDDIRGIISTLRYKEEKGEEVDKTAEQVPEDKKDEGTTGPDTEREGEVEKVQEEEELNGDTQDNEDLEKKKDQEVADPNDKSD